jgi:hypothetical protein
MGRHFLDTEKERSLLFGYHASLQVTHARAQIYHLWRTNLSMVHAPERANVHYGCIYNALYRGRR